MRFSLLCLVASLLALRPRGNEIICAEAFRAAPSIDSPDYRKYAPERQVDMLHIAIDVTPDFKQRSIRSKTTLRFKPLSAGVTELKLNADDLRIENVTSNMKVQGYHSTESELIITFAEALPMAEQEVTISYTAFPKKGLYFRTAEMGYLPEDEHMFSQGEDIDARHWFPCFDAPNDKITSEITCHVPEKMTVLSNGHLVSEESGANRMKAVHWMQDKPHTTYLISLVAGYFKKVDGKHKETPLAFYVPGSQIGLAETSFQDTFDIMDFFEQEIGVPFPWDKYYQVCVQDFMWGGMENTSVTTLTDQTLFPPETENIRSSQGLVAHEMAHQWFGDLVTCKDWSQVWLNEGFATYYAHLYDLHRNGRDDFLYGLYDGARSWINNPVSQDSRPVVFRNYAEPVELFGYLVYPKGAWVLHMLRNELGPDVYRQCVKTYLERHRFRNTTTHDLAAVCEEISGRSLDRFFDQWIFHPHHPELQVGYSWDEPRKLARLSIAQTQELTNGVALFEFPLKVRFKGPFGTVDKTLQVKEKQEDFFFPLSNAPDIARLDPDYVLLARIRFDPPRKMLAAQLKDETDLMGRIFALGSLDKSHDKETIDLIADRLRNDPFYGVRVEAAQALRTIHTKEAMEALLASTKQSDARVRQKITTELANFFDPSAERFEKQVISEEKNPDVKSHAVRGLASYPAEGIRPLLEENLRSESFEDLLGDAAIAAMRAQNDPSFIPDIISVLEKRQLGPTSRGLAHGLDAVAYLARNEQKKDAAYNFIVKYINSSRSRVQEAAIKALGVLRDDRALPVLATFASGAKDLPETTAAARAIETIRENRPVITELQGLRNEVIELKKQNDELKKSFDELSKKFDATSPKTPESAKPKKQGGRKGKGDQ